MSQMQFLQMPITRRFHAGDTFFIGGLHYRVVPGHKKPGDLKLEWSINGSWCPVSLDTVALVVDFMAENEEFLWPPPRYQGRQKIRRFLDHAISQGWEQAVRNLNRERAKR